MIIELSKTDIEKILSTMSIGEIKKKLLGKSSFCGWIVTCEASHPYFLRPKED